MQTSEYVIVVSSIGGTVSVVSDALGKTELRVKGVATVAEAAAVITADGPPALVVSDAQLEDGTAIDVMAARLGPPSPAPVVVVTEPDHVELAVEAMRHGANAFLNRPLNGGTMRHALRRALGVSRRASHRMGGHVIEAKPFVGLSPAIRQLAEDAAIAARTDVPVLVTGETGTGKGILVRWLHDESVRARGPFIDVNCSSLSKELFESELYGFERGAFTGAATSKVGLIEAAHGGTMFLDEIADLDLTVQPRLLKVVEDGRFRRLGSVLERHSDARFVAASNTELNQLVSAGRFRQDLLFRINTLTLRCPSLRERMDDVPALAIRLAAAVSADLGRASLCIAPDAMAELLDHHWPGNIRELHHVIQRAAIMCTDGVIRASDVRFRAPAVEASTGLLVGGPLTLEALQRRHIQAVLEAEGWNVELAAHRLGIPRSTLYQKIKTLQLGARDPT
ncbi:sigma-54 dependent transcriptional regulator [Luteitalea sp.]|uniref:sigma-54 dependent transcriptional regulator n=1 Tax=Luteitalea sp. TaxID=2004800 RepID=UPI0025BD12B7|nr:sigma-54 dependent transcriptional regulator [Luteitalea sp.]